MDRKLAIGPDDILTNVPYHPDCGLWFDNHLLTDSRSVPPAGFRGRYGQAPSAARVVYAHYSATHPELARHERLLAETDRLDSAQLTMADVVSPHGYVLLGFTLDARSGLGRLPEYFSLLLPSVRDLPGRGRARPARGQRARLAAARAGPGLPRGGARPLAARGQRSWSAISAARTRCPSATAS